MNWPSNLCRSITWILEPRPSCRGWWQMIISINSKPGRIINLAIQHRVAQIDSWMKLMCIMHFSKHNTLLLLPWVMKHLLLCRWFTVQRKKRKCVSSLWNFLSIKCGPKNARHELHVYFDVMKASVPGTSMTHHYATSIKHSHSTNQKVCWNVQHNDYSIGSLLLTALLLIVRYMLQCSRIDCKQCFQSSSA